MTIFKQGDTVLVPYPFTDEETEKKRPALILSSNQLHNNYRVMIMSPITGTIREEDGEVKIAGAEIAYSGLAKESVVRTQILFSVNNDRVIKKLGTVPEAILKKVLTKVINNFARE